MTQPLIVLPEAATGLQVVASVSGGKDSTALILALREAGIPARFVFADTKWEALATYLYLDTLRKMLDITIDVVGVEGGMMARSRYRAGFPGRMQRWCTRELKIEPLRAYHDALIEETGIETVSAMGVRGQESAKRALMPIFEDEQGPRTWGGYVWRPLIEWKVEDVIEIHKRHGIPMNPLYHQGFDRVGCFPCIFENKEGIRMIGERYPERIDELDEAEVEITEVRRLRNVEKPGRYAHEDASFFQTIRQGFTGIRQGFTGIRKVLDWARTDHGGKQMPLLAPAPTGGCMRWGICETAPTEPMPELAPEAFIPDPAGDPVGEALLDQLFAVKAKYEDDKALAAITSSPAYKAARAREAAKSHTWACSECGSTAPTHDPCADCGSLRVVLISVLVEQFGEDWRDAFKED